MRMPKYEHIYFRTVHCIANVRSIIKIKLHHKSKNVTVNKFPRFWKTILVLGNWLGLRWIPFNLYFPIVKSQGLNYSVGESILSHFKKTSFSTTHILTPDNQTASCSCSRPTNYLHSARSNSWILSSSLAQNDRQSTYTIQITFYSIRVHRSNFDC